MARRSDPDFVTGRPPYEVQPPIVHPAFCACVKCSALPADERAKPHAIRVRRKSPHPDSRVKSAAFALEVKADEEAKLREAIIGKFTKRRMSLEQIAKLRDEQNPHSVSEATMKRDRLSAANLVRIIGELAPGLAPEEIDMPVAVRYRNTRLAEGVSPRTVLNELGFLLMLLKFGVDWKRETGMAGISLLSLPDVDEPEPDGVALTEDEFAAVLSVSNEVNRRRMIFGVTTMLRRSVLFGLRAEWISTHERWLSVPAEAMKKGRSKRRAPLEIPLSRWSVAQVEGTAEGYVWPNLATGRPLGWVEHVFRDAWEAAKVRPFSCHDLRTTGSSWLESAGVDELLIAILLGHRTSFDAKSDTMHVRSRNVTRLYTKVFAPALREAVDVFDQIGKRIESRLSLPATDVAETRILPSHSQSDAEC